MESGKMTLMNVFSGQQWRNRHREQTYGHGGKGEGELYRESNMAIYNSICKIDSQWEFAVWLRKLKQGWDGEGDGRQVQKGGDICIPKADSCKTTKFCKAIILQQNNLKIF